MSGSGQRLNWPNPFSIDAAGIPRAGAQLFFYQTGTNTPQATYSDPALTVPNTNPVIADSAGQFGNIFLLQSPAYKVVLEDAQGNQVFTADPVGFSSQVTSGFQAGFISAYAGSTAPAGWLLCYGQAISRTTYAALFSAIGTAFGAGDGSTTFGLPDLRGRLPVGRDDMGTVAANRVTNAGSGIAGTTLGASGGDQLAQQHTHTATPTVTQPTATVTYPGAGGQPVGFPTSTPGSGIAGFGVGYTWPYATVSVALSNTGVSVSIANAESGAGQNMPPAQIVNYIIFTG
jgi:microcystin-dependent protein